ncbi:LysM peptidoglycan-binding domain-containing protein [uncultured Draconibacterium sp.]|uniref:amino acid ABC transporter substrate-binding protein n=1 Tax=uncultured Draconibacterium sp. TaxID=1573823 RepID=UPI0025F5AB5D|nr:LysM peptidoglycan-binding domain-containing protein [uncultured Draconibacterium sp.]
MRSLLLLCCAFFLMVFNEQVNGQNFVENEIVVIQGEKYLMHHVRTGETIYSISKKYGISQSILEQHNPSIKSGLSIAEVLKIPYAQITQIDASDTIQKGDPDGFTTHRIESKKETAYFIAKKYGITVEELYAYNPTVRKFKKRTKLNIPYWNTTVASENAFESNIENQLENKNFTTHQVVSGETLFSLAKKYNTTTDELLALNPEAQELKAGMTLKIKPIAPEDEGGGPQPIHKSSSKNYIEHIIESGETMWGTTRKYNVSEEELKAINPILKTGFPAGAVIKIPVPAVNEPHAMPVNSAAFDQHLVQKGETLYGLSKQYSIEIPELIKYNPVLDRRNLVYGETILIPKKLDDFLELEPTTNVEIDSAQLMAEIYAVEVPVEIPESCRPDFTLHNQDRNYTVALFLPFFYEANDTLNREDLVIDTTALFTNEEAEIALDTTIELEERKELFKQFYGGSENFVQFYEGALLAIDSLQNAGFTLTLNVYDTQRNADSIRQFFQSEEFLLTDLIIGPIFPNVQNEIAAYAAKNRIPFVSPLASQTHLTEANANYFQVNPSRDYLMRQTAEMVAEEHHNSNFIIVKTSDYSGTPDGNLVELLKEKFFNSGLLSSTEGVNFTIYDFKNEGTFGLRRIMSKQKENVVFIPSSNEGELSVAISNVNNLADDYSITLIGTSRFPNYSSIQIEHFHNLKLKYIAPYYTDYSNKNTIGFIKKYKQFFGTEPDNFGFQGFDVTMYFVSALISYGADFADCLPYMHTYQMQGNYHFEKLTQFGGYMNEGVSVISYTNDYEVLRKRVKGQPRLVAASVK